MESAAAAGLSEREFWNSTFRYLQARAKARDRAAREQWEMVRFLAFYIIKTVDAKNKVRKPEDVMQFGWDEKKLRKSLPPLSPEDLEALEAFGKEADVIVEKMKNASRK